MFFTPAPNPSDRDARRRTGASHLRDQPQDPRHPHQPVKSEETSPHCLPHAKGAHTVDIACHQQEGAAEAAPQEPEAPTSAMADRAVIIAKLPDLSAPKRRHRSAPERSTHPNREIMLPTQAFFVGGNLVCGF